MRPPTDRPGVGGDAAQLDDAPGPAVDHLQGVEGDPRGQLHVAETREVLDAGEVGQPGQPRGAVVPLELVERLLLGPAPLVGGAQIVHGQLGQADAAGPRCPGSERLAYTRSEVSAHGWRARAGGTRRAGR